MGDNPGVGPQPNEGSFPHGSQAQRQNSSQVTSTDYYEDGFRKGLNRPGNMQPNYPSNPPYQQHQSGSEAFSMTTLGNALPDMPYPNYAQRYPQGPQTSALMYQMPNVPQFVSPAVLNPSSNNSYNMTFQAQFPGMYAPGHQSNAQHAHPGPNASSHYYPNQGFVGQHQSQQPGSSYFISPGNFGPQAQMYGGNQMTPQYQTRSSFSGDTRSVSQQRNEPLGGNNGSVQAGKSSSIGSSPSQSSVVRGPPRKPRQSGHAIWIGNLPPQTDLMSLVLHVCKETDGLESLFLISKSNCAFANFKDEASCIAAQAKIHDSRFQTVRLVSRLRKASVGTVAGVSVPTGPAALAPPQPPHSSTPSSDKEKEIEVSTKDTTKETDDGSSTPKEKFFIVKSLTVEDLELSVRNGIWATQTHNEEALNKAYQTADNVYLIFSANKSGEYFGYARMISPINEDPAAAIEFAPKAQAVEDPDLPKAIPTPASEFAPKGRIIDDSARGTIFWEIERDEADEGEEEEEVRSTRSEQDSDSPSKAWGKPFKIEWVSTTRLPFYRTRGLRNPWNSNREVKIARDGTELETAIGRRLLGLFHRLPSPVAPSLPQMSGLQIPMMGTYPPQMRPFP